MQRKKENLKQEISNIFSEFTSAIQNINITDDYIAVSDQILKCKGKIITTGMGKAGIAMQKFSSLLCSLGFPSAYLHPGEASHGDLGLLSKNDILFVASTSGKTREVIEIIDLARNLNIKTIIGITSHVDSPIRKMVNYTLDMGIIKEAGHLGLAPTTSILIILAITDSIALVSAKRAGLDKEKYSKFHHSGYLGSIARNDGKIF